LRRRVDAAFLQDRPHRAAPDPVPNVLERALDPRVAPSRILRRHPDHQLRDLRVRAGSTGTALLAPVVLLRHELPIPLQDRVRGAQRRELRQAAPAELLAKLPETPAPGDRQPNRPGAQSLPERLVLLQQVVDRRLLPAPDPDPYPRREELEWQRQLPLHPFPPRVMIGLVRSSISFWKLLFDAGYQRVIARDSSV